MAISDQSECGALKKIGDPTPPCRRCIAIRFFIGAVVGTALLNLLSPQTFELLKGQSTLTLSLGFVGTLAVCAVGKAVLELRDARSR